MKLRERFRIDWPLVLGTLQKRGMTLRQVADRIGCSHAALSKLNTGERRVAGYDIGAAALQLLAITTTSDDTAALVNSRPDTPASHLSTPPLAQSQENTQRGDHSHHDSSETHSRD